MSMVMNLNSIEDTILWKHLNDDRSSNSPGRDIAVQLKNICADASTRMKIMPTLHSQYTLHDETHLLRVTELMALLLNGTLNELNPVEIALLILAAHFHDQGMILSNVEYKEKIESEDYKCHKDLWKTDHPTMSEIEAQLSSLTINNSERESITRKIIELENVMISEFIRKNHGKLSSDYILKEYSNDKRFEISGLNIANQLALLCESHVYSPEYLTPENGFRYDAIVGRYQVNLRFLAIILRLADILDFDRDRTPDVLYRSIHFESPVSIIEWEKHRSVQGWIIRPDLIRFDMEFSHPIYEKATRDFFDWIDTELLKANEIIRSFPNEFSKYSLILPTRVNRSGIGPKNKSYVYYDLEFSLSRDEIVKLLMTNNLYSSTSLFVRELLQNSLDALRYRKAMFKSKNIDWKDGKIEMEHFVDNHGYEVVRCIDNGIGMDELIIKEYLTKVGRSFYRSTYFEQDRIRFRQTEADFEPCSQFGIGFMSNFMFGDRIHIETRRDYGYGKEDGKPIVVEINGLGGILVVRSGNSKQKIGTTITITSRDKQSYIDEFSDKVQLIRLLNGYALATEFPIYARCKIPQISQELEISPGFVPIPTIIEESGVEKYVIIEQSFSEIDERMIGIIRQSFIVNKDECPTLENHEACWRCRVTPSHGFEIILKIKSGEEFIQNSTFNEGQLCMDGILICGPVGKAKRDFLSFRSNQLNVSLPYILDVRGTLKPEITPARTPPQYYPYESKKWLYLYNLISLSAGHIFEQFTENFGKCLTPEEYWILSFIYNGNLEMMRSKYIWDNISISLQDSLNQYQWRKLKTLTKLYFKSEDNHIDLITPGNSLVACEKTDKILLIGECIVNKLNDKMKNILRYMSTLSIENEEVILILSEPSQPEKAPIEFFLRKGYSPFTLLTLPYSGSLMNVVTVQCEIESANRNHPLVKYVIENQFVETRNILQEFADSFISFLSDKKSLDTLHSNRIDRWMKSVAHKYFEVDWSKYTAELRPPYQIWLKSRGIITITEKTLSDWRDSKTET